MQTTLEGEMPFEICFKGDGKKRFPGSASAKAGNDADNKRTDETKNRTEAKLIENSHAKI